MNRAVLALAAIASVCAFLAPAAARAAVRTHYIASDEIVWNYAPSGRDLITGKPLSLFDPQQLGWKYHKIVYHEYTDATFTHLVLRPSSDDYMGIVGPIIHAEVGDTVDIVFKNNSPVATNIALAGGASARAAPVKPHATARYVWRITDALGPGLHDGSSVAWRYYSTVDETNDESVGMFGPLVVTRRGAARPDGSPADVDREAFAAFTQQEEGFSRLLDANVADPAINKRHVKEGPLFSDFTFANDFFTINGFVFGNMPMLTLQEGERTRWYVIVTGSSFDAHTPHWHGQTVLDRGMRTDIIDAQINEIRVVDMVPDNPGVWLFHCHVRMHLAGGMEARFAVVR